MLNKFRMDLHIHTCLSPCGDETMVPSAIISRAKKQNLDCIGICDHNSAENVTAVRKAGEREALMVMEGLEISSCEEVHILTFFEDDKALLEMQNIVFNNLSCVNDENFFGMQLVVDENDRIISSNNRLLIDATGLSVNEIVRLTHNLDGIAIASHIDSELFSIISQLGFIPNNLSLDALEISPKCTTEKIVDYENLGFPLVTFSDAHFLSDIGKSVTTFSLNALSFLEIKMALHCIEGRKTNI